MSTGLLFPRGGTAVVPLAFGQSIVGATLTAYLQRGPRELLSDALVSYTTAYGLSVVNAAAGTATLVITPADCALVNFCADAPPYWCAFATLANGIVLALDALQGPIIFSQIYNDLHTYPPCTTIVDLGSGGTITPPNYVPDFWVPGFTSVATLTAISTLGLPQPLLLSGTINGALVTVSLVTGTQATGGGVYQPNDNLASGQEWVTIGG